MEIVGCFLPLSAHMLKSEDPVHPCPYTHVTLALLVVYELSHLVIAKTKHGIWREAHFDKRYVHSSKISVIRQSFHGPGVLYP